MLDIKDGAYTIDEEVLATAGRNARLIAPHTQRLCHIIKPCLLAATVLHIENFCVCGLAVYPCSSAAVEEPGKTDGEGLIIPFLRD